MKALRLGTRKSALAQAQAKEISTCLRSAFLDLQIETVLLSTSGDERTDTEGALEKGGLKTLFTKEIEDALLEKRIDLAVHSMKDLAGELPKGLMIGAVPEREDPRDVWISKNEILFQNLRQGAKVGTGAVRRQAQIKHLRPDINLLSLRGNVDTRLRKLAEEKLDGIILALAGLKRLKLASAVTEILPVETMLPAIGQGALAIETRQGDIHTLGYLKSLDHSPSHQAALAERAFLKTLGGNCQTPLAGYASIEHGELTMLGLVISPDGQQVIRAKETGRPFDAAGVGERLAQTLLKAGADKILAL